MELGSLLKSQYSTGDITEVRKKQMDVRKYHRNLDNPLGENRRSLSSGIYAEGRNSNRVQRLGVTFGNREKEEFCSHSLLFLPSLHPLSHCLPFHWLCGIEKIHTYRI